MSVAETVAKYVLPGGSLLDFGCGPCDKTALLALMGYECTGADDLADEWHDISRNRETIADFAASAGIRFVRLTQAGISFPPESFDMLMLHHVVEHLHNSPRSLLIQLLESVKPGGYLFITVPNHANARKRLALLTGRSAHNPFGVYYWYPDPWRGHVREYTKGDCVALADYLELDLVEIKGVHHMLEKVPLRLRGTYKALSRLAPGMRDTWSLVARKPKRWSPRRELSASEFRRITGLTGWTTLGGHEECTRLEHKERTARGQATIKRPHFA